MFVVVGVQARCWNVGVFVRECAAGSAFDSCWKIVCSEVSESYLSVLDVYMGIYI